MEKDYFNGNEWVKVDDEWLEGIDNIRNISEIYKSCNDKIRVIYNNGKDIYYQNCHGTWAFPVKIR